MAIGGLYKSKTRLQKKNILILIPYCPFFLEDTELKSQKRSTRKVFVYKIQVNPFHTILKYGDYHDFTDG